MLFNKNFGRLLLLLSLLYIVIGIVLTYHGYNLFLFHLILCIFLTLCTLLSLILSILRKNKQIVLKTLAFSLSTYISIAVLQITYQPIRNFAFSRLAVRSEPLITAIKKYEIFTGHAPELLNHLVPAYISKIYKTGLLNYPEYEYSKDDNKWVLYVKTPRGLLNWDLFLYFPDQNYSKYMCGGYVERIGKWAYIHE